MSMNDPDWGKNSSGGSSQDDRQPQDDRNRRPQGQGGQDGPPDLDELWRDFNNRLNRLFGKKGGGQGGGPRGPIGNGPSGNGFPPMPGAGKGVGFFVGVLFLLWLASGFFIIEEGKAGVVLQFGKYSHTETSGFKWRLPYPIQSHEIVDVSRVRIVEVGYRNTVKSKVLGESLMLTDDENIIDIQFAVQFRLSDARAYLFSSRDPDESVKQAAETAIREVVGRNKMDYVLYEGREDVALKTREVIQSILDRYGIGVLVNGVTVQNVQPPEQVQAAFDDAVKAGQDRERLKNEGQAYANDVIPRARGMASRLAQEAEGYKERVIAQAQGDASRFNSILVEYARAPKVTRDRLYIEAMQQIYTNVTKVMVDTKSNSQLLYLPLDKLMQQSVPAPAGSGEAAGSSGEAARAKNDSQSPIPGDMGVRAQREADIRESIRNRDRGAR